jgi:F0F1-type ATP synthase assembly protein I
VVCIAALGALVWHTAQTEPAKLWVLLIMTGLAFGAEAIYRRATGRELKKLLPGS